VLARLEDRRNEATLLFFSAVLDDARTNPGQPHVRQAKKRSAGPAALLFQNHLFDEPAAAAAHFLGPVETHPAFLERKRRTCALSCSWAALKPKSTGEVFPRDFTICKTLHMVRALNFLRRKKDHG